MTPPHSCTSPSVGITPVFVGPYDKPDSLSSSYHHTRKLQLGGEGCGSLAASVSVAAGHPSRICSRVLCHTALPLFCSTSRVPLMVSCHASEHSPAETIPPPPPPPTSPPKRGSFLPGEHLKMALPRSREHPSHHRGWSDTVGEGRMVAPALQQIPYISLGCRGIAAV